MELGTGDGGETAESSGRLRGAVGGGSGLLVMRGNDGGDQHQHAPLGQIWVWVEEVIGSEGRGGETARKKTNQ